MRILILALSLLGATPVQPAVGTITGTVVEARTNAPLAAVLVKVQSTGQQAFSDADGHFEIRDVPVGSQTVLVSVVGYGLVRRDVSVGTPDAEGITIAVAEGASTYVEEVSVGGGAFRPAEPGVATQSVLGSRELLALRGLVADDPFRAVQVLPGVATGDDFRGEFAMRGLGPDHIGISIDGVDTPLLFHTVRGVQDTGSLALINTDILESASLLAGPHPERLNAHLGSRLDFTTRDGARDRLRVRGLLSASAASTVVEGPLASDKASWLVSVRESYIDWLLRQVDATTDATFGFTDGQAKLSMDLTPRQSLRASVMAGHSVLRENDNPPDVNTLDPATSNTVIGNLQWRFTPSTKFTTTQQVYLVRADYRNRVADGRTREEGRDRDATWRAGAQWIPTTAHLVEFGGQVRMLSATRLDRRFTSRTDQLLTDASADTWSAAGWVQHRWSPTPRVAFTPGARIEHWELFDQSRVSPWALVEMEIHAGTRVRAGASIQHQSATLDHAIQVPAGTTLVPERAATVEAGVEQQMGAAIRLNVAAYHRRDTNRIRDIAGEARVVGTRGVAASQPLWSNRLSGPADGAEVVLERRSVNGLNGWLAYSWNRSTLTDGVSGETFAADFDQRHTVNAYLAYRWSGRTSVSARIRYGSNFPIVGYIGHDASGYVLSAQRNGLRVPEYARLDLRADRTFTYRKSRLTLFLEVVNATNRDNYRQSSTGINLTTRRVNNPLDTMFPLLPVAGVLFEF